MLSRYVLGKPPENNGADIVVKPLEEIFTEHGCQHTVQCDNGSEFFLTDGTLLKGLQFLGADNTTLKIQGKVDRQNPVQRLKYGTK